MSTHTADSLACVVIGAAIVALLAWGANECRKERAKERRVTEWLRQAAREMPLMDRIAHDEAATLDAEWDHLATLALTDWPPMPEDAADLPRTW